MKISCDIIRDILPLYAEDMVSDATKEIVDDHLCQCDACTKELGVLKKADKVPAQVEVNSLKRVGDSIRRRRILAVMAVFLFIATVMIGGALMLDATIYLSASEAVEDIYVEGEAVKIVWDDCIIGTGGSSRPEDTGNYAVVAWTNLHNLLFPSERIPYDELGEDVQALISRDQYDSLDNTSTYSLEDCNAGTNFWYLDPRNNSYEIIFNAEKPFPEGPLMDVGSNISYYVFGTAVLCIFSMTLGIVFKDKWYCEVAGRISVLFGSLSLSAVIVTAGQFAELYGRFTEMVVDSTAVAVPMTLFGLCVRQLVKLNRQDRGL